MKDSINREESENMHRNPPQTMSHHSFAGVALCVLTIVVLAVIL